MNTTVTFSNTSDENGCTITMTFPANSPIMSRLNALNELIEAAQSEITKIQENVIAELFPA